MIFDRMKDMEILKNHIFWYAYLPTPQMCVNKQINADQLEKPVEGGFYNTFV